MGGNVGAITGGSSFSKLLVEEFERKEFLCDMILGFVLIGTVVDVALTVSDGGAAVTVF